MSRYVTHWQYRATWSKISYIFRGIYHVYMQHTSGCKAMANPPNNRCSDELTSTHLSYRCMFPTKEGLSPLGEVESGELPYSVLLHRVNDTSAMLNDAVEAVPVSGRWFPL